jgi:hypothetical protein
MCPEFAWFTFKINDWILIRFCTGTGVVTLSVVVLEFDLHGPTIAPHSMNFKSKILNFAL